MKLSSQLQDAYMSGDTAKIKAIKKEIEANKEQVVPTKKSITLSNPLFENDQAPVMALGDYMSSSYGSDWEKDEIETIDRILWLDHGIVLTGVNRDKLLALKYVKNGGIGGYYDWPIFNNLALALGGAITDPENFRRPSPGMIINAIKVMEYFNKDLEFSVTVKDYITSCLISDGLSVPPSSIANVVAISMKEATLDGVSRWKATEYKLSKEDFDETQDGIQASRISIAEEAANKYYK